MLSSVSYKINESLKDKNVQIIATCNGNDNKTIVHTMCPHWSDHMNWTGPNKAFKAENNFVVCIKVNISVNIMEPPPCPFFDVDGTFTDFHLGTEDGIGSVPVHRVVMAAHSEVFKTMLTGQWKETAKGCLEVKGVTRETIQHLKDYMYLGSLPEHEALRPLLLVAKCYMMRRLEEACADKLAQTVEPDSLMDLLKFATDNHLSELVLSMFNITSHEVVLAAFEQKPKLGEVEK